MKLLLYCCKNPHKLYATNEGYVITDFELGDYYKNKEKLNGKIVAECDYEIEEIELVKGLYIPPYIDAYNYVTKTIKNNTLVNKACLTYQEMEKYFGKLNYGGKNGYAIHIKNLHIFDKPKELGVYYSQGQVDFIEETELWRLKNGITTVPQNMCYAYKYSYSKEKLEKYILISIRPEWLCKILNGEKTIEIRKKVLKEMLK